MTQKNFYLTPDEKQSIKVLNFIALHDGIITNEDEIRYLLQSGIEKFIHKSRQNLISISKTAYPIKINIINSQFRR